MREALVDKIRKVSLRYGFYSYLVKIKGVVDWFVNKLYKDKKKSKVSNISAGHILWNRVQLSERPIWKTLAVQSGARLLIKACVQYCVEDGGEKKAILLFKYYDKDGKELEGGVTNLSFSSKLKASFKYLEPTEGEEKRVYECKVPSAAKSVKIGLARFNSNRNESVVVDKVEALIKSHEVITVHDPKQKRYTSDLTVACVLDEFTAECLSHEVNLIKLTQEAWQRQLEKNPPDFLLVESCWRGNGGNWGTLTKGSGGGKKLGGLLRYCKENKIPTVFWNKEDPPHYGKFGPVAALFDIVITTDVNMVPNYQKDFGIIAHPLSFAAQPKIHNPSRGLSRKGKAVFAGSYYSEREERCQDFHDIVKELELARVGYDIYDRNHMSGIERFVYPEKYTKNIVGKLLPEEMWRVNKGYKYQINLNTVKDSSTMFARRVYESLASGTPVISNDAVGVRELFGDLVIINDRVGSISEKLQELETNEKRYNELARAGVRRVMREHTYSHRIKEICDLIGVDIEMGQPEATLVTTSNSFVEVEKAKAIFADQTYTNKRLFVCLGKFNGASRLLNESNGSVSYAMELGKEFYDSLEDFYRTTRCFAFDINQDIEREYLEDSVYWSDLDG